MISPQAQSSTMYCIWWQSLKTVSPGVANELLQSSRGCIISRLPERALLDDVSIWISSVRIMAILQCVQSSFNLLRVWLDQHKVWIYTPFPARRKAILSYLLSCLTLRLPLLAADSGRPWTISPLWLHELFIYLPFTLHIRLEMSMKYHKFVIIESDFSIENSSKLHW